MKPPRSSSEPNPDLVWLRHNRIDLALHRIWGSGGSSYCAGRVESEADGATDDSGSGESEAAADVRPLLLLHGLGERTPQTLPHGASWPGPVWGLDFTGHGRSTVPVGGGYTSEILAGDVDAAIEYLGEVTILGRGLGAYVALLIAAARPDCVIGAVLADGPGLVGGGVQPGSPSLAFPAPWAKHTPDPFAMLELSHDVRPSDYAQGCVRFAAERSQHEKALIVTAVSRPEWLSAVAGEPGVGHGSIPEALALYGSVTPRRD